MSSGGWSEALWGRREGISAPTRALPPRRVLLGIFRGGPRASAPPPRPPAFLGRPARGRQGSWAAHLGADPAPFSSFRGWSPDRRDVPEPRDRGPPPSSQTVQTLTHSCLEGRRRPGGRALEPACLRPLSWGWGPGAAGRRPGEKWGSWARAPSPPILSRPRDPGRAGSPCGSSSRPRAAFAARILSPARRLGGRSP